MPVLQVGNWNAGGKSGIFHGFTVHLKELEIEYSEPLHDALFRDYCVVPLTIPFPQKARQSFKNTCEFHLKAKQFVILKTILYYFT